MPSRATALAALLAVGLAACGSSGSSGSSTPGTTTPATATATIASKLVLGGPPECPTRPYCEVGLQNTYGLHFKSFKPLDAGGPITVAALKNGKIDVALLFTTSGVIAGNGWVLLKDDKTLQPADNVTPVLNNTVATAYGKPLATLVNQVSSKITTDVLTGLQQEDRHRPAGPRGGREGCAASTRTALRLRPTRSRRPARRSSSAPRSSLRTRTLADIYAGTLQNNGYPISKKLNIGSREIYFPALKSNQVSFIPDYAGSLLTFVDPKKPATTDPATNATELAAALKPLKLTALTRTRPRAGHQRVRGDQGHRRQVQARGPVGSRQAGELARSCSRG